MTTATKTNAYSHSRLEAYSRCPLAFKLQFIDKVPTEDSDAMEVGAAAHEFFDQWIRRGGPGISVEHLAAKCFQKESRNQDNFKDYLEICKTFAESYKEDPDYPIAKSEVQIAFNSNWKLCEWFDGDVRFRAKIDLILEPKEGPIKKVKIKDWKTGFAGSMGSAQLDIYTMAVASLYPELEQAEVSYYYIQSGFSQVKLLEIKDIEITRVQIDALAERIDSDTRFKAKPGQRCLNCSVAAFCDQKPGDLVTIGSLDDAKVLGAEIAFMEAQAKAKKKALNVWCGRNGPVEIGGLVYNHFPTESIHVDMGPFLSACVNFNVDPSDVLNPDSRGIKRATKKAPGFGEAIAPYVGVDVGTRFYSKKADGDGE